MFKAASLNGKPDSRVSSRNWRHRILPGTVVVTCCIVSLSPLLSAITNCLQGRHFLSGDRHFGEGIDHEQAESALLDVLRDAWHFNTVTQLIASMHAAVYAGIDPKCTSVLQPPPASLSDVSQFSAEFGDDLSDNEDDFAPAPIVAHAAPAHIVVPAAPAPVVAPAGTASTIAAPAAPSAFAPTGTPVVVAPAAPTGGVESSQALSSISRRVPQPIHSPMAPMLMAVATLPSSALPAAPALPTAPPPPTAAAPPFTSFANARPSAAAPQFDQATIQEGVAGLTLQGDAPEPTAKRRREEVEVGHLDRLLKAGLDVPHVRITRRCCVAQHDCLYSMLKSIMSVISLWNPSSDMCAHVV